MSQESRHVRPQGRSSRIDHSDEVAGTGKRFCSPGKILIGAVSSGDVDRTSAILAAGVDLDSTTDSLGKTALHLSAMHGHTAVVRALLEAGASTECVTPHESLTPLRLAAERGHISVTRTLLDSGARCSATDAIDCATPLHAAAEAGHVSVILELAARGADLEARAFSGQTPLRWALSLRRLSVVEALLRAGADPDAPDRLGASCLHGIAAMEVEDSPVHAAAAMATATAMSMPSPASPAERGSPGEMAQLLLAYGAFPNFVRPSTRSVSPSSQNLVPEQVVEGSFDSHGELCGVRSTPDSCAFRKRDCRDLVGETPLHVAARECSIEVAKALLMAGAGPNVKTSDEQGGLTALHYAAAPGDPRRCALVKLLLAAGADVGAVAADGVTTPLRMACMNSAVECVEELLRWGNEAAACSSRLDQELQLSSCSSRRASPKAATAAASAVRVLASPSASPVSSSTPRIDVFFPANSTSSPEPQLFPVPVVYTPAPAPPPHGEGGASNAGASPDNAVPFRLMSSARARSVESMRSLPALEEVVGSRVPAAMRDPLDEETIRTIIKRAPADRAWRRRGWLMILYQRYRVRLRQGCGGVDELLRCATVSEKPEKTTENSGTGACAVGMVDSTEPSAVVPCSVRLSLGESGWLGLRSLGGRQRLPPSPCLGKSPPGTEPHVTGIPGLPRASSLAVPRRPKPGTEDRSPLLFAAAVSPRKPWLRQPAAEGVGDHRCRAAGVRVLSSRSGVRTARYLNKPQIRVHSKDVTVPELDDDDDDDDKIDDKIDDEVAELRRPLSRAANQMRGELCSALAHPLQSAGAPRDVGDRREGKQPELATGECDLLSTALCLFKIQGDDSILRRVVAYL